jgi:hypothetical protein
MTTKRKKEKQVVCPYCGTPGNSSDSICRHCGNETGPSRLYANPAGSAWRGLRLLHRLPATEEPNAWTVQAGLLIFGLLFFVPSVLALIARIRSGAGYLAGRLESVLFFGLLALVGLKLMFNAFHQKKRR